MEWGGGPVKVLLIDPGVDFSCSDVSHGWRAGFETAGCQAVEFNLSDRLNFYAASHIKNGDGEWIKALDNDAVVRLTAKGISAVAFEWWPDLVVFVSGFYVPPDTYQLLRARRIRTVMLFTESPYEDERQIERAGWVDAAVVNDPTNLDQFRAANPASWYLPHAHDPARHRPGPARPELASDFAFVGTGYPSRIGFFERVDWADADVALAGNWQGLDDDSPLRKYLAHDVDKCCPNEDTIDLYRSAKASANLYRREAQRPELEAGWSMGPREVELAATGCFYLTEARGENREVLPMVPTFDGPADFGDKLRWWLTHDPQRETVSLAARLAVVDRTFTSNARQLLELLGF